MNIKTQRLLIRRYKKEDKPQLHALFGNPKVMRFCEPVYTLHHVETF